MPYAKFCGRPPIFCRNGGLNSFVILLSRAIAIVLEVYTITPTVYAAQIDAGAAETRRRTRQHGKRHVQWLHQGLQGLFVAQGGALRRTGERN